MHGDTNQVAVMLSTPMVNIGGGLSNFLFVILFLLQDQGQRCNHIVGCDIPDNFLFVYVKVENVLIDPHNQQFLHQFAQLLLMG